MKSLSPDERQGSSNYHSAAMGDLLMAMPRAGHEFEQKALRGLSTSQARPALDV
jgi:hypothetical protein